MNTYFGYIRVSTTRQGDGVSLQEQRAAIEAHAERHGLTLVDWFEECESASKRGRPQFNRMLKALEKGQARGVIIHKVDRSARHLRDWGWLGELSDRGVDVRFAHENIDMNSRGGRLTADLLAVVAADYSRNLRDEVRKGFIGRLKQGLYPLPAPVGYLNRGRGKAKIIDPLRGPLVRLAFELYATGAFSIDSLRRELFERGLRTKGGRPLTKCGISTMLRNPFYIAIIRLRNGECFAGVHEALIAKRLFDQVQAVIDGRLSRKVQRHDYLFRRMLRCEACRHVLTGESQKGRVYYRCHTPRCLAASIREDAVLARLDGYFASIRLTKEELQDLRDAVEEDRHTAASLAQQRSAELTMALGKVEDRLTRLTDALLDGLIDKEEHQVRRLAALGERKALQDALSEDTDEPESAGRLKKFELANTAQLSHHSQHTEEIRDIVRETTSNLLVHGKELAITPCFPFGGSSKTPLHQ